MRIRDPEPDYLRKSIESVFSQNYDHFELIVVFDLAGSCNDELASAILEEFSDDHRLKMIRRSKAGGRADSMNQGLLNSKGEFIAVLDCDDYWLPNRLSEQIDYLHATNVSFIGSWAYAIDENDRLIGVFKPPVENSVIRKYLLLHNPFWHSTIMFRREIIEQIGLYESKFDGAEDYEFYIRTISSGYLASNIPKFLVCYRVRAGSFSRQSGWRNDRYAYVRAKLNAVLRGNCRTKLDILHLALSPIALVISPKRALNAISRVGWYYSMHNSRDQEELKLVRDVHR